MTENTTGTSVAIATPDLEIIEGQITTTSTQVAAHFNKRHSDVLRAIRNLTSEVDADFYQRNFASVMVEFTNGKGGTQQAPAYRITRDGFTLLAMGFTGKEAMQWKVAYLTAFNKMEAELRARTTPYSVQPGQTLTAQQASVLRVLLTDNAKKLPKDKQAKAMIEGWSKLKSHFGVPYRQIPAHEFEEALSLLTRHVTDWELVNEAPKAGALNETVAHWVKQIETPNGTPALIFMPLVEAVQRKMGRSMPAPAPTLRGRRWLIETDAQGVETVQPIGQDDFVANWSRLVKDIASGECLRSSAELVNMANACTARLQQRMNQEASRANAVLFRQTAPGRLERVEHG